MLRSDIVEWSGARQWGVFSNGIGQAHARLQVVNVVAAEGRRRVSSV